MRSFGWALAGALCLLLGCGDTAPTTPVTWTEVSGDALEADAQAQHQQALAARDDLMAGLFARLSKAIQDEGTPSAISVCSEAAPALAAEVAQTHALEIGRTSFKLRNPTNAAPGWAAAAIAARSEQELTVRSSEGSLGLLLPIRVAPPCLQCHGPAEGIVPEVRSALAEKYPQDQAVGFADGDLRGWFWVEVPARN